MTDAAVQCAAVDYGIWCVSVLAIFLEYGGFVIFSIDMQSNWVKPMDGSRYLMLWRRMDL